MSSTADSPRSLSIANKVKIVSLGGIEAIIKAMSTHQAHSGIQEGACGVFRSLATNDGQCCFDVTLVGFLHLACGCRSNIVLCVFLRLLSSPIYVHVVLHLTYLMCH